MITQSTNYRSSPSRCRAVGLGPMAPASRLLGAGIHYVDHPSFNDPSARDVILALLPDALDDRASCRLPSLAWLAGLPAARSRARLLSREQESHLFRKMNYLKFCAHRLEEQFDPEWADPRDLGEIDRLRSEALAIKHRIVEKNLGLVVSIAKTRVRSGYDLADRVSEGSVALVQAVDRFDFARGCRFSTYATWAIRNALADQERRLLRGRAQPLGVDGESLAAAEPSVDVHEFEEDHDRRRAFLERWLGRLDRRDRRILESRYGIGGVPVRSLSQIGRQMGISKERVRQIENRARAKLRKFARGEKLEMTEI